VQPAVAGGGERPARARAKKSIVRDQRAVEVAGERLDAAREVGRELQPLVDSTT